MHRTRSLRDRFDQQITAHSQERSGGTRRPRSAPGPPRSARLLVGLPAAAVLLAAVFPANVKMAYDRRGRPAPQRAAAYARLPLRAPLIGWALKVSRDVRR